MPAKIKQFREYLNMFRSRNQGKKIKKNIKL